MASRARKEKGHSGSGMALGGNDIRQCHHYLREPEFSGVLAAAFVNHGSGGGCDEIGDDRYGGGRDEFAAVGLE